ncbi:hypothetical protein [Luteimonas abyssi]|uniref:hypothetical protein n=1 Tax=Luteimonas abyssi TaxID=1247514 RepID=UPI000AA25E52|nr:hypothetical protein [Luteimonas abyssi]
MLELSEAVQQLLERNTQQVVQEAQSHHAASPVMVEGDVGSAAPWRITWDTAAK